MVFIAHLASTLYMVGLIWFVQIVHYPLHGYVGASRFSEYQHLHMNWTSLAVGPAMLIEAGTTLFLVMEPVANVPSWVFWMGGLLLLIIWASTGLLQVPLHNGLLEHFDAERHKQLVRTNWIRTICWTCRGGLVLYVIHLLMRSSHQ